MSEGSIPASMCATTASSSWVLAQQHCSLLAWRCVRTKPPTEMFYNHAFRSRNSRRLRIAASSLSVSLPLLEPQQQHQNQQQQDQLSSFEDMVQQSPTPILVDFYAPWCGPCQLMSKVVAVRPCRFLSNCFRHCSLRPYGGDVMYLASC